MAAFLKTSLKEFIQKYCRRIGNRLSLLEKGLDYDCVFLQGKQCQLYDARPRQCRTFPWWPENLETPAAWQETAMRCEGVDHKEAPLVPFTHIQNELSKNSGFCNLYVIRHGQTVWNAERRIQGQQDSPLTPQGVEEIRKTLSQIAHLKPAALYSSHLGRAQASAMILADHFRMPPVISSDLQEGSYGTIEGLPLDQWEKEESVLHFHGLSSPEQFHIPIAPGAETRKELAERGALALKKIASRHPDETVIAVSHGALMRSLKMSLSQDYDLPRIANGEVLHLISDGKHLFLAN